MKNVYLVIINNNSLRNNQYLLNLLRSYNKCNSTNHIPIFDDFFNNFGFKTLLEHSLWFNSLLYAVVMEGKLYESVMFSVTFFISKLNVV